MLPDPDLFARLLTAETGLPLSGTRIRSDDQDVIELVPAGHQVGQTFRLRASLRWRSVVVSFEPGAYASALVDAMKNAAPESRSVSESVLAACVADGAEVKINVDGNTITSRDSLWASGWSNFSVQLARGQLDVNSGNHKNDTDQLLIWTGRLAAAMLALMPFQSDETVAGDDLTGYPEGATVSVTVNRYERDRRNRAAALAIHGYRCKACDELLSDRYGGLAAALIEVHHVTPVSTLGTGYLIDPRTDLVPLCPNCHSVAHLRTPPLAIEELRERISSMKD